MEVLMSRWSVRDDPKFGAGAKQNERPTDVACPSMLEPAWFGLTVAITPHGTGTQQGQTDQAKSCRLGHDVTGKGDRVEPPVAGGAIDHITGEIDVLPRVLS